MADAGIPTTRLTRRTIRRRIGEISGWEVWDGLGGKATTSGSTTTLLDADLYSSALDQKVRRRDYFLMLDAATNGADSGKWRYITATVDSSGTITWSGVLAGATVDNDDYEIWAGEGPNPDVLHQCIDRALQEACWYWRLTPLTQLRGGDIGDELIVAADDLYEYSSSGTKIWTGSGDITLTLEDLDMPDEFTRRVIRLVGSGGGADAHIESNVIEVDPTNRPDWYIRGLVRSMGTVAGAAAGTGNGTEIKIMDKTNSAEITPDDTLGSTNRAWTLVESRFTIPATCHQIAIRLNIETSGEDGEFAWVQLTEDGRTQFPLPARITSKRRIGPVYERTGDEYSEFRRRPWQGSLERREAQGRGVSLHLSPPPGQRALWYYEKVPFPKLTSAYTGGEGGGTTLGLDDDNVTWCPLEWVAQAAMVECYKYLIRRDRRTMPERWLPELEDAESELIALQDDYGIEGMLVEDSPKLIGVAILPV